MGANEQRIVVGVDEVGRGAFAGPVVVAGFACRLPFNIKNKHLGLLRDSKKLTARKREEWYDYLMACPAVNCAVARVTPHVIDRVNISAAANRASLRVIRKLALPTKGFFAYLDAGLKLPESIPHRAIIRGDEKMKIIAAASIIAKVVRDRYMVRLHKRDPRYRFDVHKGYGTELHRERIKRFGYSDYHRKSFILR